jgi:hypothetical protein
MNRVIECQCGLDLSRSEAPTLPLRPNPDCGQRQAGADCLRLPAATGTLSLSVPTPFLLEREGERVLVKKLNIVCAPKPASFLPAIPEKSERTFIVASQRGYRSRSVLIKYFIRPGIIRRYIRITAAHPAPHPRS